MPLSTDASTSPNATDGLNAQGWQDRRERIGKVVAAANRRRKQHIAMLQSRHGAGIYMVPAHKDANAMINM